MLNRVVTNGNVIDVGTSKEDGSFIVSVPNKALFKVGTDGKITIETNDANMGSLSIVGNELTLADLVVTDTGTNIVIESTKPIHINSPETKLLENNEDRVDQLRLDLADILSEISTQMDTIITDSGSTADTANLNTLINNLKNI